MLKYEANTQLLFFVYYDKQSLGFITHYHSWDRISKSAAKEMFHPAPLM